MPLQLSTPLAALGTTLGNLDERLRSLEQYRVNPGGMYDGVTTFQTTTTATTTTPWSFTFQAGLTGVFLVFTQVVAFYNSFPFSEVVTGVTLDGGSSVTTGALAQGNTGSGYPQDGMVCLAGEPNAEHTVVLTVSSSLTTVPTVYSQPFLFVWPF